MFSIHPTPVKCGGDPRSYWKGFQTRSKISPFVCQLVWSPCLWKEGRRKEANFLWAAWGALDFDDGRYTLEQARAEWQGRIHLIGTTKSHQVAKNGGEACDRFRILFPWAEPICDLRQYRYNMQSLVEKYGADEKCIDGARFYWPCREVVSLSAEGVAVSVSKEVPKQFEKPVTKEEYTQKIKHQRGFYQEGLPPYIYRFIYHGQLFGGQQSRNVCCYTSARFLLEIGWPRHQVLSTLLDTPFSREDFKEQEIHAAVASAERSITQSLGVSSSEGYRRRRRETG